jgi:hypothetical protein
MVSTVIKIMQVSKSLTALVERNFLVDLGGAKK